MNEYIYVGAGGLVVMREKYEFCRFCISDKKKRLNGNIYGWQCYAWLDWCDENARVLYIFSLWKREEEVEKKQQHMNAIRCIKRSMCFPIDSLMYVHKNVRFFRHSFYARTLYLVHLHSFFFSFFFLFIIFLCVVSIELHFIWEPVIFPSLCFDRSLA